MTITREQADRILWQILNRELPLTSTTWQEGFRTTEFEAETIGRGLDALAELIPANTECALHGWIDQAVLEIVAIGRIYAIRNLVIHYRADQGGDTGVIALKGATALVLDLSFESSTATLMQYGLADQDGRGQQVTPPESN